MHPCRHHHPRHHWSWAFNPIARYARIGLRRRLFLWFGAVILLTGLTLFAVLSSAGHGWLHGPAQAGVASLAAEQLAQHWQPPDQRSALLHRLAAQLDLPMALEAPDGTRMDVAGSPRGLPVASAPVQNAAGPQARLVLYAPHHVRASGSRLLVAVLLVGLVLWMLAGRVAWGLSRPIVELTRVAQELGAGRLSSRMQLRPGRGVEAHILARSLNDMAERLERQVEDQRELLAAVSHELRTPLARIRVLTELARTSPDRGKPLEEMDREVEEMDALVGQLLASSRLDFSALTFTRLNARDLWSRALERARCPPGLLDQPVPEEAFEGDATLLLRALANLLDNAVRHGAGPLAVRSRLENGQMAFEVDDDGPGFAPADLPTLFSRFRAGKGPRSAASGLGLGLALVGRIAQAHGGRAYASNREPRGARVGLEIPLRVPRAGSARSARATA